MKVLSLIEPYATLIREGSKKIETRSWKTNYRGELYIHASMTKIPSSWKENNEVMSLVKDKNFHFGEIICKCILVDCVYMNEEFISNLKANNYQEYICGDYQVGRYAWILDKVEMLDKPIKSKGHLGIWEFKDK